MDGKGNTLDGQRVEVQRFVSTAKDKQIAVFTTSRSGGPGRRFGARGFFLGWSSNPTWGVPFIQAESHKLGIDVSDSTVRRYRPPRVSPPSQNWRSFLENHLADFASIDFFIVQDLWQQLRAARRFDGHRGGRHGAGVALAESLLRKADGIDQHGVPRPRHRAQPAALATGPSRLRILRSRIASVAGRHPDSGRGTLVFERIGGDRVGDPRSVGTHLRRARPLDVEEIVHADVPTLVGCGRGGNDECQRKDGGESNRAYLARSCEDLPVDVG
jgi:hypothetical protein